MSIRNIRMQREFGRRAALRAKRNRGARARSHGRVLHKWEERRFRRKGGGTRPCVCPRFASYLGTARPLTRTAGTSSHRCVVNDSEGPYATASTSSASGAV